MCAVLRDFWVPRHKKSTPAARQVRVKPLTRQETRSLSEHWRSIAKTERTGVQLHTQKLKLGQGTDIRKIWNYLKKFKQ